jgi:Uma2 family endonuclease
MASVSSEVRYTPEDLLNMPDGDRYELINGQLVERNMGAESSRVAQVVNRKIDNYAEANGLGLVWGTDCGYQIFGGDANRVRYADGSFVRRGRLPGDVPPQGHMRIAPDLALEVVSPNDLAWEVQAKVVDWLAAGVKLLWVFYPDIRSVHVYRPDGGEVHLRPDDGLSGGSVLPGFSCRVADCFPSTPASAPA